MKIENISRNKAFTIVELLIVIVVIAILAAISVVAYNGIQNRVNDSAIQSDLAAAKKKLELYKAENDDYPRGPYGNTTNENELTASDINPSKEIYPLDDNNLGYCALVTPNSGQFIMFATSKSGKVFSIGSNQSLTDEGVRTANALSTECPAYGYNTSSSDYTGAWGYNAGSINDWRPWTD